MALPLRYSLGNLVARRTRTLLTMGGIALVVVATTLFAGLVSSLQRTLVSSGQPRNLIVMRKGATNDGSSALGHEAYQTLRFLEGVARCSAPERAVVDAFDMIDRLVAVPDRIASHRQRLIDAG